MESIKILLLSIVAAVVYGVLHDQVTARICLEYFTVGHVGTIDTDSATLIALFWGVVATWWMGLIFGVALMVSARWGGWQRLNAKSLVLPVAFLLVRVAFYSVLGGFFGYWLAVNGWHTLPHELSRLLPRGEIAFIAVLWAHWVAYGSAALEGLGLCYRTWKRRTRLPGRKTAS